ncbi:MAG: tetratricopeptide repeat protein [Myxococcota bacterium]
MNDPLNLDAWDDCEAELRSRGARQPGDATRVEELVSGALGRAPPPGGGTAPASGSRAGLVAAAAVAAVVAAVVLAGRGTEPPAAPVPASHGEPSAAAPPAAPVAAPPPMDAPTDAATDAVTNAPSAAATETGIGGEQVVAGREAAVGSRAPQASTADASPAPKRSERAERRSAAELLRAAGSARDDKRPGRAASLYRQLFADYPDSREAVAGRVAAGRLELDTRGNPKAALRHFQRYLRADPRGTLAEEAMLGRALAFQRLGRTEQERRAWQELLKQYPASVHAERARRAGSSSPP